MVFVHARVRPIGNKDWREVRLADVYPFRDGKAIRMQAFADLEQALKSVGIDNPPVNDLPRHEELCAGQAAAM